MQRLRLEGGAASSLKFQPVLPHHGASLAWLWSVVRLQGLHHQFGLSGAEMQARQQLFGDSLRFAYSARQAAGEAWCCIDVAAAPAPAGPEA